MLRTVADSCPRRRWLLSRFLLVPKFGRFVVRGGGAKVLMSADCLLSE